MTTITDSENRFAFLVTVEEVAPIVSLLNIPSMRLFSGESGARFFMEQVRRDLVGHDSLYSGMPNLESLISKGDCDRSIFAVSENRSTVVMTTSILPKEIDEHFESECIDAISIYEVVKVTENGWVFSSTSVKADPLYRIKLYRMPCPTFTSPHDELKDLAKNVFPQFDRYCSF